jgi:hypothetical protein
MARSVKAKQVLSCVANPAGSKYPFRLKCLEKAMSKIDDTQSVETVEVTGVNSVVEVPKGTHLVIVTSGVMTERVGREIKSVMEWERVDGLVPAGATAEKILQMLALLAGANTTSATGSSTLLNPMSDSGKKA